MAKKSSGILLYRLNQQDVEVFLAHPGGPFFSKKDIGVWSIPKGEFTDEEDALMAAQREFFEETGTKLTGEFKALTPIRQKGGKTVLAWAVEGDIDEKEIKCNLFQMEWPPKSGKIKEFPEIDKGEWFTVSTAKQKIVEAQADLIDQLVKMLKPG